MSERLRRRELLAAYEKRRIEDQLTYHEHRLKVAQRGRRQILDCSTLLYTITAFVGAMAASSVGSRSMWAVLAAATGAGASALTGYALMAGFERNEEQSRAVLAALSLLDASRPETFMLYTPDGGKVVSDYVRKVESLIQQDVELWARSAEADQQELDAEDAAAQDAIKDADQDSVDGSSQGSSSNDLTVTVDESGNASPSVTTG
jgi:hypothetical protein